MFIHVDKDIASHVKDRNLPNKRSLCWKKHLIWLKYILVVIWRQMVVGGLKSRDVLPMELLTSLETGRTMSMVLVI